MPQALVTPGSVSHAGIQTQLPSGVWGGLQQTGRRGPRGKRRDTHLLIAGNVRSLLSAFPPPLEVVALE